MDNISSVEIEHGQQYDPNPPREDPFVKARQMRQEKKQFNIELTERLMLRGIKTTNEITQALAKMDPPVIVDERTVMRYKAAIFKKNKHEADKKIGLNQTIEELALHFKKMNEEVARESWKQYHAPNKVMVKCPHCDEKHTIPFQFGMLKIQALKLIKETTEANLKTMQSLGLINTAPTKHQMVDASGNPIDPLPTQVNHHHEYTAFIKAKYMDPVGTIPEKKIEDSTPVAENANVVVEQK